MADDPELIPREGDSADHSTACHFPVDSPEEMVTSRPTIGDEERIVEPEAVSADVVSELSELTDRGTQ